MELDGLPDVRLEESGVTFKYLVLRFDSDGQGKVLVRGVNYRPYEPDAVQRIVNWTWDELEASGFREGQDDLTMVGGGTLSINPYYEKVTLFGELPGVGAEPDREATSQLVKAAFPDHSVEWFPAREEKPKKQVKKPPAKPVGEADDNEEAPEEDGAGPEA